MVRYSPCPPEAHGVVEQADGFRSLDDTEQHVTVARVEFGGTQRDHPPEGEVWGSFLGCRGELRAKSWGVWRDKRGCGQGGR